MVNVLSSEKKKDIAYDETEQHYSLDEELISHLPTCMRLANLIMYAKLMRAMDLASDQDYPEWCTSPLLKLANKRQNYRASLLS